MDSNSYEAIRPLMANHKVQGRTVVVAFRDPDGGDTHPASAMMREDLGDHLGMEARRQVARVIQIDLGSRVRSMLGGGWTGEIGRQMVTTAARNNRATTRQRVFDEADERDAVIEAFATVAHNFRWDPRQDRWVDAAGPATRSAPRAIGGGAPRVGGPRPQPAPAVPAPQRAPRSSPAPAPARATGSTPAPMPQTAWDLVLTGVQISDPFDREVLARMLAEVAASDGQMGDEEREFFDAFADVGLGTLEAHATGPKLTDSDLAEVDAELRDALMLLAMAVAYADEKVAPGEVARLDVYREGLGISPGRHGELDAAAREHVVQALYEAAYAGGRFNSILRNQARRAGMRLGLSADRMDSLDGAARAKG